jgi:hypothetical protein
VVTLFGWRTSVPITINGTGGEKKLLKIQPLSSKVVHFLPMKKKEL